MNSEVIKEKFISYIKNENCSGKFYPISISQKAKIPLKTLFNIVLVGFVLSIISSTFLFEKMPFVSSLLILGYLFFTIRLFYRRIKSKFFYTGKPYEATLRNFIYKNNLYSTFPNGDLKSEIEIGYIDDEDVLSVIVGKDGGIYQEATEKLGERLESALGLILYKKKSTSDYVQYIFRKYSVDRYSIQQLPLESEDMNINIYDMQNISLRANFSTLISGSSGSGKSYCSYYILASLYSKNINNKHLRVFAIDPKMSDIYKLMMLSSMSENYYGSTVAEAFRIVKEFTEELEKRKEIYSNINEFDKTLLDLGYEPMILFIDEYPSLVALMDNKQKKDFENKLGNIARLGRQLSMGIILVMQQANSESLPTAIKEQLVNRIFMGNSETISQQSAEMVFGQSRKDLPSPLNEIGEGIISIDGKEPVAFLAPKFMVDMDRIVLPVIKNAAQNYKDNSDDEVLEKEEVKTITMPEQDWEQFL